MDKGPTIAVLGDINIDAWFLLDGRPHWNEVLHSNHAMLVAGGKGLNMALGVARLGGDAKLLAIIGNDIWGQALKKQIDELLVRLRLVTDGRTVAAPGMGTVSTDNILVLDVPTPVCGVLTKRYSDDPAFLGTKGLGHWRNVTLSEEWKAVIRESDVLVACLAPPIELVCEAIMFARECGALIVLNPGPPPRDSLEYERLAATLGHVDVIVPNEYEARTLVSAGKGHSADFTIEDIANILQEAINVERCGLVCITRGRVGFDAAYSAPDEDGNRDFRKRYVKGKISAVTTDPVGRGDAFCAALAVELGQNKTVDYSLRFAATAASVAFRTEGAAAVMPSRSDVETALRRKTTIVAEG